MPFAQLVIGPPGSGKSTYCEGMSQFMNAIERPVAVVNLDPANDHTNYEAALDVRELVSLDEVMETEDLGPNGAVLYALEEVENNFEWLENGLTSLGDKYVIFDCPGQVELFTHHESLRNIFTRIQKLGYRLTVVHLIDSFCLTQPTLYISSLLLSLRSMLQMELSHINVLTKIDNLKSYGALPMPLEFYTEASDLDYLMPHLEAEQRHEPLPIPGKDSDSMEHGAWKEIPETTHNKFTGLNQAIIELVEDYGLVGFEVLAVEDKQSMSQLLRVIDRAGGYAYGPAEGANETVWQLAVREGGGAGEMSIRDIEERWIDRKEEMDAEELKRWEAEKQAAQPPSSDHVRNMDSASNGIKVTRKGGS